jgi:RNA-binding protein Musashi
MRTEQASAPAPDTTQNGPESAAPAWQVQQAGGEDMRMDQAQSGYNAGGDQSYDNAPMEEDNYGPINVKEDG